MALTLPVIDTEIGTACPPAPNHSDKHSVTIHMPKWQAILDFVEGKPAIMAKIKNIYPRFMPIADVADLTKRISNYANVPGHTCLLFPSKFTAEAAKEFAISAARKELQLAPDAMTFRAYQIGQIRAYGIFFPEDKTPSIIPYWQNAGVGISSRFAEACLRDIDSLKEVDWNENEAFPSESATQIGLRKRIIEMLERAPLETGRPSIKTDDVFLFQTGMAAIYHVHRYLGSSRPGTTTLFGFAFHSTPHTLEDFGSAFKFFGLGTEIDELEQFLKDEKQNGRRIQGLWAEFPANPLLVTPDLSRLRALANEHDFPLLIDDTVSSFCNVDVLGADGADVLITSLTKSFNGYADVMAGSAVVNPSSRWYQKLRQLFDKHYTNDLFEADAEALLANSQDYIERSKILNHNAEALVDYLVNRSKEDGSPILKLWYPTTSETKKHYDARMRPKTSDFTPGYGCLFSVELKSPIATQAFYDKLGDHLHVGPHLGAHLTLILAFNKAIYAKELERVKEFNVLETQIRVSVGLEETEVLIRIFEAAIEAARLAMIEEKEVVTVPAIT
ncbi:putative cystathionine gamma-synthase [Pseudocercospora fuligena]|uniref:Putative cystathionine gamma-synthase n=1 Tax=Pseudocercospora fuligena TaxID=685502 RepID=A0A8H6VBV2_9PEZI|nr:putative cystathionine gamma-synthase [Pseudocercospora fuligena]